MDSYDVYQDIKTRTGGEIYLGVVGPVRTGKSTFIKRFVEQLVLPDMTDEPAKARTVDELPQSAAGKTIMTTEPKFIPKDAAHVRLADGIEAQIRLIDCVGFMVEGASGHIENQQERMVKTPWFQTEIPFTKAAEIGTRKVIKEHSTIGVVVTTDGSFGELKRDSYINAEETAVRELKEIGKPFIVLLNSSRPYSEDTRSLAGDMQSAYGVTVLPVNCEQLKKEDISRILELVLKEFPVTEVDFFIPRWMEMLPASHWMKDQIVNACRQFMGNVKRMKDIPVSWREESCEVLDRIDLGRMNLSDGTVTVQVSPTDGYYYQVLSDFTGLEIGDEYQLMHHLKEFSSMRREYQKVLNALVQVRLKGYGVVTPDRSEIVLDEPTVIRHGNKYGVKMRAEAPSLNLIKAHIQTEIAPIVGSEQQAEDLISYMKENARNKEGGIWETNIFGKSIEQIVEDGIQAKVNQMTEDCQMKLQDALQKIINDSNGGMICIII
ncbi:MAG: stage IV sporulation protein A [Lachnospiraceae bacterium]|nr:stage IV sporulation protein A [Lachnospiraceae bacterium]MCI8959167.1 stage IV sporulation protein A [Lachnospiraceae bacterium]